MGHLFCKSSVSAACSFSLVSKFTRNRCYFVSRRAPPRDKRLLYSNANNPSARATGILRCSVYRAAGDGSFACTPPPMIASGEAKKCVAKYAGGGERQRLVCPLECVDPPRCLRLLPGRAALGRFINHVVAKTLEHGSAHT